MNRAIFKPKSFSFYLTLLACAFLYQPTAAAKVRTAADTDAVVSLNLNSSDFSAFLQDTNQCANAGNCPTGAYMVNDAATLYKLGTVLGGSQNHTVAGKTSQFSKSRYAILIPEQTYKMPGPFLIGYYTEILGVSPDREKIILNPGVNSLNDCDSSKAPLPEACLKIGGLNNFWRAMGNFSMDPTGLMNPIIPGAPGPQTLSSALRMALSQSSPIRNIHFKQTTNNHPVDLLMCDWLTSTYECGYTSGGFLSDSVIDTNLLMGSQQQYYLTQTGAKAIQAGTWNMVLDNFKGIASTVALDETTRYSQTFPWVGMAPYTQLSQVETTPYSMLKPRLIYTLNGSTPRWSIYNGALGGPTVPTNLSDIGNYVVLSVNKGVSPSVVSKANIQKINTALASANTKGLLVMPGVYSLLDSIIVPADKTVLGIGIATMTCNTPTGNCMRTASRGVRVAGILLDAGVTAPVTSPDNIILTVGKKSDAATASDPVILQDVYCRVGKSVVDQASPSAHTCFEINADYTIGQNLWIWRADHDAFTSQAFPSGENSLVTWEYDESEYGLVVNGNEVHMDGLAVEHFQNYQTVWNGSNGILHFYQSEIPYVMPAGSGDGSPKVSCFGPNESKPSAPNYIACPALYISASAKGFKGYGLGVYSYFPATFNTTWTTPTLKSQRPIHAEAAIKVSDSANATIVNLIARWLNGDPDSGIMNLVEYGNPCESRYIPSLGIKTNGTSKGYAVGKVLPLNPPLAMQLQRCH